MEKIKTVLKKFKNGGIVESREEEQILNRYASTGMIFHLGFSATGKPRAKLSDQGRWFLKQL